VRIGIQQVRDRLAFFSASRGNAFDGDAFGPHDAHDDVRIGAQRIVVAPVFGAGGVHAVRGNIQWASFG
tara:strand:- start:585 stop:791 length:207 start_codon:yes stop_codon:yes gene_type:complete